MIGGKKMRKRLILAITVLLAFYICGCTQRTYDILLKQDLDEITRISLVDNTGCNKGMDPTTLLVLEEHDEIVGFITDLTHIKCRAYSNDPPTSLGYLYVEILYRNGDSETIGTDLFIYKSVDGTISEDYEKWFYVDMDSMCDLFVKYVGVEPSVPFR